MSASEIAREFGRERDALVERLFQIQREAGPALIREGVPPVADIVKSFDRAYTLGIRFAIVSLDNAAERGLGIAKPAPQLESGLDVIFKDPKEDPDGRDNG